MFCPSPFNALNVQGRGFIPCCPAYFTNPDDLFIGYHENLWDVWNHKKIVKLREAWLNEDSSLCKPCPILYISNKWKNDNSPTEEMKPVMDRGPVFVRFANDMTCNLHCWSCRVGPIIEKQQKEIYNLTHKVLDTFHESIRLISTLGSGDPFASPSWRKILFEMDMEKHKHLNIELFTNGLLIPKYWDQLKHMHDNIKTIKMSIDAVSPDIYERTRLGGKHKDLITALEFISKLDKRWAINMVVQSDNFMDIPNFIETGIRYNCSRINLTMLRYWPKMAGGKKLFNERNLANKNHPKHDEYIKFLEKHKDILSHPKVYCEEIFSHGQDLIEQYKTS